jgi:RimJ/RimL family protein N-acetyltransferase
VRIDFRRLPEVDASDLIALMNDPRVRRHMPLSRDRFDAEACAAFIEKKESMWSEHGYGPWAFFIGGRFAGWGGCQPENGEPDLGLVLHPDFWGRGRAIYEAILDRAFGPMGFDSVTVLLPPGREHGRAVARLGFQAEGSLDLGGRVFMRYRLRRP